MHGDGASPSRFVFPRWANYLLPVVLLMGGGAAAYVPVLTGMALSPKTLNVGYAPEQPIPFNHRVHAGELGMDCRYCHSTVEQAGFAAIPPAQTCMNCHANIKSDSPHLLPLRKSVLEGTSVDWVKVHDLADYSYFNHSAHVNQGIGCATCHGRIDRMDVVRQVNPLSMGWCLDCHRQPERFLRPREEVTNMDWQPPDGDQLKIGRELKEAYDIHGIDYMTSCSTCHR